MNDFSVKLPFLYILQIFNGKFLVNEIFSFILFLFKYLRHPERRNELACRTRVKYGRKEIKQRTSFTVPFTILLLSLISSRLSLPYSAALPSCFVPRGEVLSFRWDIVDDRDVPWSHPSDDAGTPWSRPSSYYRDLCFEF